MKKNLIKRIFKVVFFAALFVFISSYSIPTYANTFEDGNELSGTYTDEDNSIPGGSYTLTGDTVFSGDSVMWTFEKTTTIDLCGHKLKLEGVTLSVKAGGLNICDSVGNGSITSYDSQLFHVEYSRRNGLYIENADLNYLGEDEDVIPVYTEAETIMDGVTLHTQSDYGVYADCEIWISNTSIWGAGVAEVNLGTEGNLGYEKDYSTFPKKIRFSLKDMDFSEAATKVLINTNGGGELKATVMKKIEFKEVPSECTLMYRGGNYCAIFATEVEISGNYDLVEGGYSDFPNVELDADGNYQMSPTYYKLTGDVNLTTPAKDGSWDPTRVLLGKGKEVFLDLNGHTMTVDGMELRTDNSYFTLLDSAGGGVLNGGFYFYVQSGSVSLESGTINYVANPRVMPLRSIPILLFGTPDFNVSGAVINCYADISCLIEAMYVNFKMTAGEINYYPNETASHKTDMMDIGSSAKGSIDISGGTIRMVGKGWLCILQLLDGNINISGGEFIIENQEDDPETYMYKSTIIRDSFNANINISGGSFTTNSNQCIEESSYYREGGSFYHLSGSPEFNSAGCDILLKKGTVGAQKNTNAFDIKSNFNIGRKLKVYCTNIPTEENVVAFVMDWTKNRGDEEPTDFMDIYLPDNQMCTPVVVDGNVIGGGVYDAPEPEPEYIDGLQVYELSGTYALNELELPNTEKVPEKDDQYYWGEGYYRLTGDVYVSNILTKDNMAIVQLKEDIVIDLNGHKLNLDPMRFSTTKAGSLKVVDSASGGTMNGSFLFWGSGSYEFLGGTINMTGEDRDYYSAWAFNLSGADLTVDGAVVNCLRDSDSVMIQAVGNTGTITVKSGELNYIPAYDVHTSEANMMLVWGTKVEISGGTVRAETDASTALINTLDSCNISITGGKIISKCNDSDTKYIADSRVIKLDGLGTNVKVSITGGELETNGEACIAAPYSEKVELSLGGNVKMTSAKYDVYYAGTVVPMTVKADFNLGHKMTVYTQKEIPSESNTVVFAKNWTKLQGDKNPKEVFSVCLPDDTTREPYVLDGAAVCGGVPEDDETLNDTGNHTWSGTYELTSTLPSGISTTEAATEVDRGTYALTADVELKNSSEDKLDIIIKKDVEIDLAGHNLSGNNITFHVDQTTGVLTIKDSVGGGSVTGDITIYSSNSSAVHLIGGVYDLKDPSDVRTRLQFCGAEFTAKDVKFITYDNKNLRAGIYITASKTTMENCEVEYTANLQSYLYFVSSVWVKSNGTFTNCRFTASNAAGEATAVYTESGKSEFINCVFQSESKKITSTYGKRACAVYVGSSSTTTLDGGQLTSNGTSCVYSYGPLALKNVPKFSGTADADIGFNNGTSNTNYVTLSQKINPEKKIKVNFVNKDFSR
ncbi:MAG: hypothetical protein K6F37_02520, partial [Lachnospiraceae bacterium]|nr:hypothetical protein [Lachnospiraceae bacterium]